MRLITATTQTQGDVASDFDIGVIDGEIVEPDSVCDRDLHLEWPGACGCGRSFVGMGSHARTTTAVIANVDVEPDQLHALVADLHPDAADEEIAGMVADLIDYGQSYDTGTVVSIWRYELEARR